MRRFVLAHFVRAVFYAGIIAILSTTLNLHAQSLTTLHVFCASVSSCTDGSTPGFGSLIQGSDGDFYGTTNAGGAFGYGSIFKITSSGMLTTLYSFCSQTDCADGAYPLAGLVLGNDENFYGTTSAGGASANAPGSGNGTVFRMTPSGGVSTLYSFCTQANCSDGISPSAALVVGLDGNLYGTTSQGGSSVFGTNAWGTAYRITPSGTLTTIYNFCSLPACADGATPQGPIILGHDGNFYGTTETYGGGSGGGAGTVFKLTSNGTLTTLYNFCSQTSCFDGSNPLYGGLIETSDGTFYGTTANGGASGYGSIFKVTSTGTFTSLYSFGCSSDGSCANGRNPFTGLIQGTDANLYGTTPFGGPYNGDFGTVFRMTPSGALTTLYSFCAQGVCSDGEQPYGPVIEGTDGNLYGTTSEAGADNFGGNAARGTVYMLATGLQVSAPVVSLSTRTVNFGMHQAGGAYPTAQVQLSNSGTGPLLINSVQTTGNNPGDFNQSNNCPTSPKPLAVTQSCTFLMSFTPAHLGPLSATVSVSDNAADSPQVIGMSGTAVDFSVSAVPVANTIKGGKAAIYNVSVTPLGGNTMNAGLTVSGCPANASCTLSPTQLTLNGSTASTATLTVKGSGKTKSGSYVLTVAAQVFTVTHSANLGLNVQ